MKNKWIYGIIFILCIFCVFALLKNTVLSEKYLREKYPFRIVEWIGVSETTVRDYATLKHLVYGNDTAFYGRFVGISGKEKKALIPDAKSKEYSGYQSMADINGITVEEAVFRWMPRDCFYVTGWNTVLSYENAEGLNQYSGKTVRYLTDEIIRLRIEREVERSEAKCELTNRINGIVNP